MARQETPRFKLPYPTDTAQSWWETFQDFALSIDTTFLGVMEANAWAFVALPEATIEGDGGGGYQLRLLGPCVVASRTFQSYLTITHAVPLALTPAWMVVVRVTSGAKASAETALELWQNGVPVNPDYRVLGCVRDDYSIAWWNASVLAPGETRQLFAFAAELGGLAKKWTASFDAVVPDGDVVIGSVDVGIAEGEIYSLVATVTAGASEAVDIELGDAAFTGGPTLLYQIGYAGVEARWNPAVDGPWVDRNPAGIEGLTGGTLYWRISNAGATPVTVHVALRGLGFEV
jgi:hypothetical protein